jgi:sugar phosphate isomerase/epimerase
MRFGAMNFPIKPVLDEIRDLADLGLDYIELAMDPPQAHFSRLYEKKKDIRKLLDDAGLGLVCHLPTFVYTADLTDSIRQASLQETVHALETCADLGAEKAVLHPGYYNGLSVFVPDQVLALAMDSLGQICRHAQNLGLEVCVENMFPNASPFVEPAQFEKLFAAFPEYRLVLDIGHAYIGDKTSRRFLEFITRFGERITHVHLSDNLGQRDDHLPLGSGTLPLPAVAKALKKIGYNDTFTLEIFVEDRRALIRSRDKMKGLMI